MRVLRTPEDRFEEPRDGAVAQGYRVIAPDLVHEMIARRGSPE